MWLHHQLSSTATKQKAGAISTARNPIFADTGDFPKHLSSNTTVPGANTEQIMKPTMQPNMPPPIPPAAAPSGPALRPAARPTSIDPTAMLDASCPAGGSMESDTEKIPATSVNIAINKRDSREDLDPCICSPGPSTGEATVSNCGLRGRPKRHERKDSLRRTGPESGLKSSLKMAPGTASSMRRSSTTLQGREQRRWPRTVAPDRISASENVGVRFKE